MKNWDILAFRCEYFSTTMMVPVIFIWIQDYSKQVMESVVEFLFSGVMSRSWVSFAVGAGQIRKLMLRNGIDVSSVSCSDLVLGTKRIIYKK